MFYILFSLKSEFTVNYNRLQNKPNKPEVGKVKAQISSLSYFPSTLPILYTFTLLHPWKQKLIICMIVNYSTILFFPSLYKFISLYNTHKIYIYMFIIISIPSKNKIMLQTIFCNLLYLTQPFLSGHCFFFLHVLTSLMLDDGNEQDL